MKVMKVMKVVWLVSRKSCWFAGLLAGYFQQASKQATFFYMDFFDNLHPSSFMDPFCMWNVSCWTSPWPPAYINKFVHEIDCVLYLQFIGTNHINIFSTMTEETFDMEDE